MGGGGGGKGRGEEEERITCVHRFFNGQSLAKIYILTIYFHILFIAFWTANYFFRLVRSCMFFPTTPPNFFNVFSIPPPIVFQTFSPPPQKRNVFFVFLPSPTNCSFIFSTPPENVFPPSLQRDHWMVDPGLTFCLSDTNT